MEKKTSKTRWALGFLWPTHLCGGNGSKFETAVGKEASYICGEKKLNAINVTKLISACVDDKTETIKMVIMIFEMLQNCLLDEYAVIAYARATKNLCLQSGHAI